MSKVFVIFLKQNAEFAPGDLAAVEEDFAERLVNADVPRAYYPEEDNEQLVAAKERATRRGIARRLRNAGVQAAAAKQKEAGEKFIKDNPDVEIIKAKTIKKGGNTKDEKPASRRRNKPIPVEE